MLDEGPRNDTAAIAAALTKAQAAFPQIPRDKTVRVKSKSGAEYTFKYAPLDTILGAVRKPLADNGLAVAQLLDGSDLVTLLLHESGGILEGRFPLPRFEGDNVQALGSAITYLRRYAIQALLGIAAEEDDDGNRAAGNTIKTTKPDDVDDGPPPNPDGSLIGNVTKGAQAPVDLELRRESDGTYYVGFALSQGRKRLQVVAVGPLAEALAPLLAGLVDQRVTVWGTVEMVPWRKGDRDMPPYQRLQLARIETEDFTLPAVVEAESVPLFPDDDEVLAMALIPDDIGAK